MKKRMITRIGACILAVSGLWCTGKTPARGAEPAAAWLTDYEQGCRAAQQGNKPVLVEITGSDWCEPCRFLRTKILDTEFFSAWAKRENMILVELDFPRDKSAVPAEEMERREAVRVRYGAESYPTTCIVDSRGIPFCVLRGAPLKAEHYTGALQVGLDRKRQFDAHLAEMKGKSGADAARCLAAALRSLDEVGRAYCVKHTDFLQQAAQLDPEDTTGVRAQVAEEQIIAAQIREFANESDNIRRHTRHGERGQKVREYMLRHLEERTELHPLARQYMCNALARDYLFRQDGVDVQIGIRYLELGIRQAPDSPLAGEMRELLDAVKNAAAEGGTEKPQGDAESEPRH